MIVTSLPQSQHAPGELGGVPGEGVAGVVGELAAAAQGEGLDVRAVAGEDQQRVVTNILIMTAMSNAMYPSSVCMFAINLQHNRVRKTFIGRQNRVVIGPHIIINTFNTVQF